MLRVQKLGVKIFSIRYIHCRCRIGRREVVGHGINGMYNYQDDAHFPYPAIRFREVNPGLQALREKERGDWRYLAITEKKALYRASFCQTFAEFQATTGSWKFVTGWVLFFCALACWMRTFSYLYVNEPLPISLSLKSRLAQLDRMIELHTNPIDGLCSKWDYLENTWY